MAEPDPQGPDRFPVEGILVINMDAATTRMEQWRQTVGCALPADRTQRLSAVVGRELPGYARTPWFTERTGERASFWGAAAGCALSHRRAIEKAKAEGWRRVLILEDDARFSVSGRCGVPDSVWPLLKGDYMLYLGCHEPGPYGRCVDAETGLWEIEGALATHAYVLSAGMYDRLLADLPTEADVWDWMSRYKAVDVFYRDHLSVRRGVHVYALVPPVFSQGGLESSITSAAVQAEAHENPPAPYASWGGLMHRILHPFHRLKVHLNSMRTHARARRGGFPGYKKKRS